MPIRKQIRVRFLDFWRGFDPIKDQFLLYNVLKKRYDVILCDDADYVFFSYSGEEHWGVPDKCVKIFFTGENLAPDFSACDYAIGFEHLEYEDRYIRFPLWLFYDRKMLQKMTSKHVLPDSWDIKKDKTGFCSFVVSNPRGQDRNNAFSVLSQYKRVDSGGSFLNNIGGTVKDKLAFEEKHKFSICYENSRHNGYTTEKLIQAFAARTVPIYLGDPLIKQTFNPDAFIDVSSYDSFDDVVSVVKALDNNDELYMKRLLSPALLPDSPTLDEEYKRLEDWLYPIFDRPLEDSYRRNRVMIGREYIEKHIMWNKRIHRNAARSILLAKLERKFKNKLRKLRKLFKV